MNTRGERRDGGERRKTLGKPPDGVERRRGQRRGEALSLDEKFAALERLWRLEQEVQAIPHREVSP